MKYAPFFKKPTNEQLQVFYDNVIDLMELTEHYDNWTSPFIHIYGSARKLATCLRIYMDKISAYQWMVADDPKFKYHLPLLSGDEKDELRNLVLESGNEALIDKFDNIEMVYDFASDTHLAESLIAFRNRQYGLAHEYTGFGSYTAKDLKDTIENAPNVKAGRNL